MEKNNDKYETIGMERQAKQPSEQVEEESLGKNVCFICRETPSQTGQSESQVYHEQFCNCKGSKGAICSRCIRIRAKRYNICPTCVGEWRNLSAFRTLHTMTFAEFNSIIGRHVERVAIISMALLYWVFIFGTVIYLIRIQRGSGTIWSKKSMMAFLPLLALIALSLIGLLFKQVAMKLVYWAYLPFSSKQKGDWDVILNDED